MKLVKKEEPFKPFTLSLEVETIEEARTLYHLFNHANLDKVITEKREFYRMNTYNNDLSSINNRQVTKFLQKKIGSENL